MIILAPTSTAGGERRFGSARWWRGGMQIAADQPITPSHSAPRWRFHAAAHDRPGSRRHLRKEMIQNASGSLDEQEFGATAAAHSIHLVD
jgi:hypothetical protein